MAKIKETTEVVSREFTVTLSTRDMAKLQYALGELIGGRCVYLYEEFTDFNQNHNIPQYTP